MNMLMSMLTRKGMDYGDASSWLMYFIQALMLLCFFWVLENKMVLLFTYRHSIRSGRWDVLSAYRMARMVYALRPAVEAHQLDINNN